MKATELSCKDLMIGDWVSYHGIVNKVAPADFCQKAWIDEIEPIPLTDAILKANGFNREGGASYWHEGDRDACILYWSEDKKTTCYRQSV